MAAPLLSPVFISPSARSPADVLTGKTIDIVRFLPGNPARARYSRWRWRELPELHCGADHEASQPADNIESCYAGCSYCTNNWSRGSFPATLMTVDR